MHLQRAEVAAVDHPLHLAVVVNHHSVVAPVVVYLNHHLHQVRVCMGVVRVLLLLVDHLHPPHRIQSQIR